MNKFLLALGIFALAQSAWAAPDAQSLLKDSDQARGGGLPGIVLWAETVEEIWRPRGPNVTVLRHPAGLARLPAEKVLQQLRGLAAGPAAEKG